MLEQVRADAIRALKAGDKSLAAALRLLVSELQKDAKEGAGDELAVLRRERKRRLDAAEQFAAGGRPEMAQQEQREAEMIAAYLPAELDDAQLSAMVHSALAATGAQSVKDLGKVMPVVMAEVAGRADGKRVSEQVRAALASS